MGLYDSVVVTCPKCKKGQLEFQSKMDECIMQEFNITNVPMGIAEDINGDWSICDKCGANFFIRLPNNVSTVAMYLEKRNDENI